MRRRRVLIVTPDFPPAKGGIQNLTDGIVSSLTRFQPTVVTLDHDDAESIDRHRNFVVRRAGGQGGRRDLAVARLNVRVAYTAMRERPDVVLSMHIVTSPVSTLLARSLGIPFVQYVHAKEIGVRPALARFALTRADRVIAVSRYTRELALGAGARADRIVIINPGVDVVRPVVTGGERPPAGVLTVSRLDDRYKGHDVVMRAFPLVRAKVPQARWRIVGDGPLRPILEDRAVAVGLEGSVDFCGRVSDEVRDHEFERARVFCMVSRLPAAGFAGEGFGIVYLEANAHGLPVVAGAVGGATDAVVDGETGLLVDPQDHVAVAEALITLLRDPAMAERLGHAGAIRARKMSWDAASRRVEEELESLIS